MMNTKISSVIDENLVLTHLNVSNKESALEVLANTLYEHGYLKTVKGYLADVYKREDEGSTGIGDYVAIPHGKSGDVNKIGVAIGILDNEIAWETLDNHGVKVIILFAVKDDSEGAKSHLKMLSLFAKKLGKKNVVKNLLNANRTNDVLKAFDEN